MSNGSSYICQNRHGTYYARLVIPKSLRVCFHNKREIRRTLQTDSRRLAIKRARVYRVQFDKVIDELMDKKDNISERAKRIVDALFEDSPTKEEAATEKLVQQLSKADQNNHDPSKTELITFVDISGNKTSIDYGGDSEKEIHAYNSITNNHASQQLPKPKPVGKLLSELKEEYFTYKKNPNLKRAWKSEDTARQKTNRINAFLSMMGDKPVTSFTIDDAIHYINIAYALPVNFNNKSHAKKFKDVTVEKILDESIDTSHLKTRKIGAILEDLKSVKAFIQWVADEPSIESGIERPLKVFKRAINSIDYKTTRRAFTSGELKILFEQDNPSPENYVKGFHSKRGIDKNLKYWLPLIALYSGATLAEICQLHLDDIFEKEAFNGSKHWVFDIYEDSDKGTRLKNSSHRPRSVPIHHILINLGLLSYIESLKNKGEIKLFPSAFRKENGYGAESQWWGEYNDKAYITDPDVTFHSFRHTLNTYLTDRHVSEALQTAISGHAFKSMSKTTYSNGKRGLDIAPLAKVINSIDYGLTHSTFKL